MAQRNISSFKSTKNSRYADSTSGEISAGDSRDMFEDTADSFLNISDHAYTSFSVNASGTDTYTATLSPAITAYTSGQKFLVKFTNANTGAATLNFNSVGAKSIVKNGSTALTSGDIAAGQAYLLHYDGTNLQIVGSVGGGSTTFASGAYTPTITNVANVSSSILGVYQYLRVGSVVTVSGSIQITPTTASGTDTTVGISLPVASDFANSGQCAGVGFAETTPQNQGSCITGDVTNNRAIIKFAAASTGAIVHKFTFTYLIV